MPMPAQAATPMPMSAQPITPMPSPAQVVTPMPSHAHMTTPPALATPAHTTPLPMPQARPSGTEPTMWAHPQTPMPGEAVKRSRRKLLMTIGGVIVAAFVVAAVAGGMIGDRNQLFDGYVSELQNGTTCEDRRAAVHKLRGLGDKRAIKPLKRARYRMRGGLAGIGSKNTNGCLKSDAEEAIDYLEKL